MGYHWKYVLTLNARSADHFHKIYGVLAVKNFQLKIIQLFFGFLDGVRMHILFGSSLFNLQVENKSSFHASIKNAVWFIWS